MPQALAPTTDDTSRGEPLRVIVVGRAEGIAQRLRRADRIELVRVGSALEAVGELSDPLDSGSPTRSVVLVGRDAEPAQDAGDLDRFLSALRRVDPAVSVLRVGMTDQPDVPSGYDGALAADAGESELSRAVMPPPRERVQAPVEQTGHDSVQTQDSAPRAHVGDLLDAAQHSARASEIPTPVRVDAPRGVMVPGDRLPGDGELALALLRGGDPVEEAIALLRRRTGQDDLDLLPPGERGERVACEGHLYGSLTTGAVADGRMEPETLRAYAAWLGAWIRLAEQHRELTEAAFTDPLTGAWNRRYFDRFLGEAVEQTRQRRGSLTLMIFDIDDFKRYNDQHGHAAGDEILCESVRLLRGVIRPTDRVCRIGGDEFAVIFYEPDGPRDPGSQHPQSVEQLARRYQAEIAKAKYPKLGPEAPGTLTISGGLATFPWDGHDAESLVERADQLALESKRQGKNALTLGPGAAAEHGKR